MLQFNLDMFDEGAINPFFGCSAAGLADNGAKIALCEAHAVGIEADLMFARSKLVDELYKAVEDSLFATLGSLQ